MKVVVAAQSTGAGNVHIAGLVLLRFFSISMMDLRIGLAGTLSAVPVYHSLTGVHRVFFIALLGNLFTVLNAILGRDVFCFFRRLALEVTSISDTRRLFPTKGARSFKLFIFQMN